MEGNYASMTKNVYKKMTANISFNCETFKTFPLILGMRQECLLSLLLFDTVVQAMARVIGKKKEQKVPSLKRK